MRFAVFVPLVSAAVLAWGGAPAYPQSSRVTLAGMWSDPPPTPEGSFCGGWCTQSGLDRLNALINDPANDVRPYPQLAAEAARYQRDEYIRPRLKAEALKTFPLDPADDPGFLHCEPWGVARQAFARHQLEIGESADRIELRYGEWDARRTVYMDRSDQAVGATTRMGHSVGRWEGQTLVIETAGIAANVAPANFTHSDQLRMTERYTRSADGQMLLLEATLVDPVMLREPLVLHKTWRWAPGTVIAPYDQCQAPTEFRKQETGR